MWEILCDLQWLEIKGTISLDYRKEGTIIELKADQMRHGQTPPPMKSVDGEAYLPGRCLRARERRWRKPLSELLTEELYGTEDRGPECGVAKKLAGQD